jgi:NAD(P)-dependent dehydrogenase (short-subunit alcohol dehydrogenase family)
MYCFFFQIYSKNNNKLNKFTGIKCFDDRHMDDRPLAIITGAAHRLGKVLALTLARKGYAILLHYFAATEEAKETEKEISRLYVPVYLIESDLTTDNGIISLAEKLEKIPHNIMVLVNSAAVMKKATIYDTTFSDWDETLGLNLRAPFFLVQQVAPRMKDGGLIVNVTDAGVRNLWTGYAAYTTSKIALEGLTRLQAKAYAPRLRVNSIAPGLILQPDNFDNEEWNKLISRLPLEISTTCEELSSALIFLLENPSITGQNLVLDSGYSLK